jgi:methylenetetrahydrofolate--tRNA-(uracil-5-)-methyltransferase
MTGRSVCVIGGGLAGAEAAWQLARRGVRVELYEMRPTRMTGAHHTDMLSELVCSNSLGSYDVKAASSLLKEEMRALDSLIIETAWQCKVPAGGALAVDREKFSASISEAISTHPLISLRRSEVTALPEQGVTILATGPLTSPQLAESIKRCTGEDMLHFFDAASPILTRESIDMDVAYEQSRFDRGEGSYINCPLTKDEYAKFWLELVAAEKIERHDFEIKTPYFESCLPIEVIAARGFQTLRFGPLKPLGLKDPRTQKGSFAVVQCRQDNAAGRLYNMVGFQTNLKWPEQKRVFSMIPGLESAEFVRLGVMHRNTYLRSPAVLSRQLNLHKLPQIFVAGQLTGVEGYCESTATGIIAAINAARLAGGEELITLPGDCMIGALIRYITSANPRHFQPTNSNWGIIDTPYELMSLDKVSCRAQIRLRALKSIEGVAASCRVIN